MTTRSEHIQLVWDRECAGTAQVRSGCSIHIGPGGEWTPEQLLTAAAESSVMSVFLGLAGETGLNVLGYVSAAAATLESGVPPAIVIRPCVVVGSEDERDAVGLLLARAVRMSPVALALGDAIRIDAEVVVLGTVEAA